MKAYKCDMCGRYVDDVYSLSGISKPDFSYYDFCTPDTKFDFCENCFRDMMHYIYNVRKNYGLEQ